MAKPPKKPGLYAPGTAPAMGKPPARKVAIPNIVKKDYVGMPETWLSGKPDPKGTIYHTSSVASASRRNLMANLGDNRPQDAPMIIRTTKVMSQKMSLMDLADQKHKLGIMAAESYKSTGKKKSPMSSLAASSIKRLSQRQTKIKSTMKNPLDIASAMTNQKSRTVVEKTFPDHPSYTNRTNARQVANRAATLGNATVLIDRANHVERNSTAGLNVNAAFVNHAVTKMGKTSKLFVLSALRSTAKLGKALGVVGAYEDVKVVAGALGAKSARTSKTARHMDKLYKSARGS